MLALAAARGIRCVQGIAEDLPFAGAGFDYAVMVTTICFVDSSRRTLTEAYRALKPDGRLVIGFIDRESPIGQDDLVHQPESVFYRKATFYSAEDAEHCLCEAGFRIDAWGQTLSRPLPEIRDIEPLQPGRGRCASVVVGASKAG
jgi:SAM-dependent methyltransferase